jgi:SAM-dependent methyltransferase
MRCGICGHETDSFKDEKTGIHYYHCHTCAYIFKSPEYYQSLPRQKLRYDLHENDEENEGYKAYFQRFLNFVSPYIQGAETALDFGCGRSTLLANLLHERGVRCDAYDPIYHPSGFQNDKKYDLIVSTEVFEHLHFPKEIFGKLVSVLNRGGILAIQTQFHMNDPEQFKQWYYHQDPTHIVFFHPQTFHVLAREYGCTYIADNTKNIVILKKG